MKVSLSWLKEYVDINIGVQDLADALTMAGLEVESVSDRYTWLDSVVIGKIVKINPHPNAQKLKLCSVDINDKIIPVICGAPNVQLNMQAPCALPGTVFPGGNILETTAIRGEISEGMLCSEMELGLGLNSDGIMELSPDYSPGTSLNKALGLYDPVIEIDLTPNRPDCLSVIGIAREIAALSKTKIRYPEIQRPEGLEDIFHHTSVNIKNPDLCPRYAASLVFDITVAPSPFWLQDRLISVGLKPINNIVDITNFVMMETGQPLHAFDYDRLAQNRIVVRTAEKNEEFTTLDGKKRRLDPEMLMICDGEKPVAIGGVMGGLNSEIEDNTSRILLESAYFNPISIRKTSKKTGLSTDASHRFERGVDPHGTVRALDRATQLIVDIAGGKPIKNIIDEHPDPVSKKQVELDVNALNQRLGTELNYDEIAGYLKSIEFEVEPAGPDKMLVLPPSCRVDITRFEDLTEEIARLYGYNNIKTTFPLIPAVAKDPSKRIDSRENIKTVMTGLGFSEAINYSFINEQSFDRLALGPDDPMRQTIKIINPLSEDQSVLRTSLIPGLLETMAYNMSVQNKNLKLFEIGMVFFNTGKGDSLPVEVEMLSGLWTGLQSDSGWFSKKILCDFFDLKGSVEELLDILDIPDVSFTQIPPGTSPFMKPGYAAQILSVREHIGLVGQINPAVAVNYDLKQPAFIFEINLNRLTRLIPETKTARPIPKFPATSRDMTLIVNRDTEAFHIIKQIEMLDEELIEGSHLFDVFQGSPVPEGKKSISIRITYRSSEQTLEDEKINQIHKQITEKIITKFDAALPPD